jgi:magnesium transporter
MTAKQLAHRLTHFPEQRLDILQKISTPELMNAFILLSNHLQSLIISKISDAKLVELIDRMDTDHALTTIKNIKNPSRREKIIKIAKAELRDKLSYFLNFHPKATASIISFNFILVQPNQTIASVAKRAEGFFNQHGKLPEIIVENNGEILGQILFGTLVRVENNKRIKNHIVPISSLEYTANIHKVVKTFQKSKHKKVVILDTDQSVIGIVYSDDAIALFEDEPTSALYDFAGVTESERSFDKPFTKVKHRYKWLIVNLATSFLAASVVGIFQQTLDALVILAIYMPIIAGMGGNAATQTLAVVVRGISVGEIKLENGLPAIRNEVISGFINGIINGVIVAIIATLWNSDPLLGLVLAMAMIINLITAGFFGAFIPLFMKKIGQDPATSATIFITTATDVLGFFVFLGLATLILL